MLVLVLDTSSTAVTAAVATVGDSDGVTVRAVRAPSAPRGHGELLAPAIAECLAEAGAVPRDVGAVVAGVGPGPYTGLRVGLVTAAAFADALGVPTYGAGSLDAIAGTMIDRRELLVVTDARRREVYWARYGADGQRVDGPHVSRPADVPLDGVDAIAGAGIELHDWPATLERSATRHPDPLVLAALAADRIRAGAPTEALTPLYLRRPDAVVPGAPKRASQ